MSSSESTDRKKNKLTPKNAAWFLIVGLAEVVGTGMLVFLGCSGITPGLSTPPPSHIQICVTFGIAVMIIIQIFGHVSGAHINPAVTLAAVIYKLISLPAAGMYMLAQFIGAILGYGLLLMMTPTEALYPDMASNLNITQGFCTTVPNSRISTIQALLSEFCATAILIYVCCSVWDKRNSTKQDSVPIKFGLTIMALATALGPYSGGSMNPARSFAPAVFTGVWDRQWIYWVGPLSAALFTTFFYKFTFERHHNPSESDQSEVPLNHLNSKVKNVDSGSADEIPTV